MYKIEYLEISENVIYEETIKKVLNKCFEVEKIPEDKFLVDILLTNPQNIYELNKKYRNIDKPTDVLSFPMYEKEEIKQIIDNKNLEFNDILGDMVISIEQVEKQAIEYGHSFERELSYMVVHSFYHLLGYDHIKEEDKIKMRPKEEYVLNLLKIKRNQE